MIWISLFMLVGASFWVIAVYLWYRDKRLRAVGLRVTGDVIRIQEIADTEGVALFLRVVKFTAIDGRTIEFTDSLPTGDTDRYRIGEKVLVLYDRWDFNRARIDSKGPRNFGLVVLLIMALSFILLAYVGYVVDISRR